MSHTQAMEVYVSEFAQAVLVEDGQKLASLVSMALTDELMTRAEYPEPSEKNLRRLGRLSSQWVDVICAYLKVAKTALKLNDLEKVVFGQMELLTKLSRCAERETNWVLPALVLVTRQLDFLYTSYARLKQKKEKPSNGKHHFPEEQDWSTLEKVVEAVNRPFKICLSDKTAERHLSKKSAVYFFAGQLFKHFHTMKKYELSTSIERAITASAKMDLPPIESASKKTAVVYLYYSGCLALINNQFDKANAQLSHALELCNAKYTKHIEKILTSLIPVRFLTTRRLPHADLLRFYPGLDYAYGALYRAVRTGNVGLFDREMQRLERFLLQRNLYYVFLKTRQYAQVKAVKAAYVTFPGRFQVKLAAINEAVTLAHGQPSDVAFTESLLSTLVANGLVKGYISHSNQVIVFSKKEPFPKQVV